MLRVRVILVEPKYDGNVGAVARLCRNFGVEELVLVNPPPLADDARERAMHAKDFLLAAPQVETFEEAAEGVDFLVGTTAKVPPSDKLFLRNPLDANELPERLAGTGGLLGLAFGREDFGLLTPELEACDLVVTVPTSDEYRSLNLSHAAAIVLYELYAGRQAGPFKTTRQMDGRMRDALFAMWDVYIESIGLPEHKQVISKRVVRKLLGRAVPSSWEFFVLMGLLKRGLWNMGHHVGGLDSLKAPRAPDEYDEPSDGVFLE